MDEIGSLRVPLPHFKTDGDTVPKPSKREKTLVKWDEDDDDDEGAVQLNSVQPTPHFDQFEVNSKLGV